MYDLIILGSGPAGLTASIYASCMKLNHIVVGKVPGGQMSYAPDILNYPGYSEISGAVLTDNMVKQVNDRGGNIITENAVTINKLTQGFSVVTESNKVYETKTIILATGVERKKLNVSGEDEYSGKGIQYCAKCERFAYQDKITAVVGGANSAAQTSIQLSHAASKVYMIIRGDKLKADPVWQEQINKEPKIEIIYNSKINSIQGDETKINNIKIASSINPQEPLKDLNVNMLFVEIGGVPGTSLINPLGVEVDPGGYISVNETLQTSVAGIYAAGDVVSHKYSIEQISSAVGSGARAVMSVFSFLKQTNAPSLWGSGQIKR